MSYGITKAKLPQEEGQQFKNIITMPRRSQVLMVLTETVPTIVDNIHPLFPSPSFVPCTRRSKAKNKLPQTGKTKIQPY